MSSTNTTLATLAGGFVPMLLKNVLSSKGTRLSLKTVSFKGQVDEIIGDYKQYWPVVDFLVQKDIPEEEEKDNELGEEGEHEGTDKSKDKKGDGATDGDKKGANANEKGNKSSEKKEADAKNSHEPNKAKDGNKPQEDSKKKPQDEKDGKTKHEETKNNGIIVNEAQSLPKKEEDPMLVDLFIDLSVADTAGWSIYGSSESLPSETIMPGYFDPDNIVIEDETYPAVPFNASGTPPAYRKTEVPITYHKEPPA